MKTSQNIARHDLEQFLQDRLNVLNDDMMWRCREADLEVRDWQCMMLLTLLRGVVNLTASCLPAHADKELAKSFYRMIQHARELERQRRKREGEDCDEDEDDT